MKHPVNEYSHTGSVSRSIGSETNRPSSEKTEHFAFYPISRSEQEVIRRIALLPCGTVKVVIRPCCVLMMTQIDRSKSIHVQISIDMSARLRSGPFLFPCDHSFTWTSNGIGGSMGRGRAAVRRNVQRKDIFEDCQKNLYAYLVLLHLK
jgi:hypothetical protein